MTALPMDNTLPELLRIEATASEELDASSSSIQVMRDAASVLERLQRDHGDEDMNIGASPKHLHDLFMGYKSLVARLHEERDDALAQLSLATSTDEVASTQCKRDQARALQAEEALQVTGLLLTQAERERDEARAEASVLLEALESIQDIWADPIHPGYDVSTTAMKCINCLSLNGHHKRGCPLDVLNNSAPIATALLSDLAAAKAQVVELEAVVSKCSKTFWHYQSLHAAKSPPDTNKARANGDMARMCDEAIRQPNRAER